MGTRILGLPAGSALAGTEPFAYVQGGVTVQGPVSYLATLAQGFAVVSVAYAAAITVDLADYAGVPEVVLELAALTGDVAFNLTNGEDGQKITVIVPQDATGSRIWTSGANLAMSDDITSIVLSTAASKTDYLGFRWHSGSGKARILAINKGF